VQVTENKFGENKGHCKERVCLVAKATKHTPKTRLKKSYTRVFQSSFREISEPVAKSDTAEELVGTAFFGNDGAVSKIA
jgi:hypothetical protein